jgi:hypothetical protein
MESACIAFSILVFLLLVITVLGHGMWLVCATLLRSLLGRKEPPQPVAATLGRRRRGPTECLRCGYQLPANASDCPRCGLDYEGVVAAELADLEAVARQLERFRRVEQLPKEVLDQFWAQVQERHERLVGHPRPSDVPATPVAPLPLTPVPEGQPARRDEIIPAALREAASTWVPVEKVPPTPLAPATNEIPTVLPAPPRAGRPKEGASAPWRRLQETLDTTPTEQLTASDRVRIVLWYRQSPSHRLDELSPMALRRLAQVLEAAGLHDDALLTYQRWLNVCPQHADFASVALEASELAMSRDPERARPILLKLFTRPLSAPLHDRAMQHWETLQRDREQMIPVMGIAPAHREKTSSQPMTSVEDRGGTIEDREAAITTSPSSIPHPPSSAITAEEPTAGRSPGLEVLAGFMEDRNILWGELVGGLLIVGGSIALVVSLWNTLQENPYFPYCIFAAVTTALFGAGLYTWNHWKLHATSRGLLVIATLLVPLTFLVMPSMIERGSGDAIELVAAGAGLALFTFCLYRAARVLAPEGRWALPVAVIGSAVAQVLAARVVTESQPAGPLLSALGLLPVACQGSAVGWVRDRLRRRTEFGVPESATLLALAGLATFAAGLALGFLAVSCDEPLTAMQHLAPLVSLIALPVFMSGLLVQERLADDAELAVLRTTGTAVALTGMAGMLLAVTLAWPQPLAVVLVCALNFGVLSWIAFRHDIPVAHAPAMLCLGLGCLTAFQLHNAHANDTQFLLGHLGSLPAAVQLAVLGVLVAVTGEALERWRRHVDATWYAAGAGVAGLLAVILASRHGLDAPVGALAVYAAAGTTLLMCNLRHRLAWLSYAGLALCTGALLWGLSAWAPRDYPLWAATLAAESLLLALAGMALTSQARKAATTAGEAISSAFVWPLLRSAEAVALLALAFVLLTGWISAWQPAHMVAGTLVTGVFFLLTAQERRQGTAVLAGLSLVGTALVSADVLAEWRGAAAPQGWISLAVASATGLLSVVSLAIRQRGYETYGANEATSIPSTAHNLAGSATLARSKERHGVSPPTVPWYHILPRAWGELILVSALLALWLNIRAPTFLDRAPIHTCPPLILAVVAWLQGIQHRSRLCSWVGSLLLLLTLGLGLGWAVEVTVLERLLLALLLHATVQIAVGLLIRALRPPANVLTHRGGVDMQRLFARPLIHAALVSTFVALPVLLVEPATSWARAGFASWLALLWLVVSWAQQRRWLLAGCQLAATLAICYAVAAWLAEQPWVETNPLGGWWEPRSLQAYGIGLIVLCASWSMARIGLQRSRTGQVLLLPDWPGVDRALLAILVVGQVGLVDWAVLRDVLTELLPRNIGWQPELWPAEYVHGYGAGGWLVQGALAVVLVLSLWQPPPGRRKSEAMLLLGFWSQALPALVASRFAGEQAAASAARWALAGAFLAYSVPVWLRGSLSRHARALQMPPPEDPRLVQKSRGLLVDGLAVPVLALTGLIAVLVLDGWQIPGPKEGSLFAQMSASVSLFAPLGFIAFTLVGYALRERSPGYAFGAGLLLTTTAAGAYALEVTTAVPRRPFGDGEWVHLLQIAAISSAAWGVVWLLARRWIRARLPGPESIFAELLMVIQVALPVLLNLCLLLPGVLLLTPLTTWEPLAAVQVWYPPTPAWTAAAGGALGWAALVLTIVAVLLQRRGQISPSFVDLCGLGLVALAACNVELCIPNEGLRAFLFGLTAFCLLWVLLPWLLVRRAPAMRLGREFHAAALPSIYGSGLFLIAFSLQAAFVHQDHLWAAAMIAVAGVALSAAGFQRRQEGSLLMGSLVLALATILGLWHFWSEASFGSWWFFLLQAVGLTLLAGPVAWLYVHGSHYRTGSGMLGGGALRVQLVLGSGCAVLPALVGLVLLCSQPGAPSSVLLPAMASVSGWAAVLVALLAGGWYLTVARPRYLVHLLAVGGILLALQAAATAYAWDRDNWLSYHVFAAGLGLVSLVTCGCGWAAVSGRVLGPRLLPLAVRERWTDSLRVVFPARTSQLWTQCCGIVLVGLASRAALADPLRPVWPVFLLSLAALLTVGLLLWTRRLSYVHILGSLFGLAGVVCWLAWGHGRVDHLLYTSALTLGAAAAITAALEEWWHGAGRSREGDQAKSPVNYLAVLALPIFAWFVLILVLIVAESRFLARASASAEELLSWIAALALPAAVLTALLVVLLSAPRRARGDAFDGLDVLGRLSFSRPAAYLGLSLLAVLVMCGLASDLLVQGLTLTSPLAWAAWALLMAAGLVQLLLSRFRTSSIAALPLYMAGLLGVLLGLHQLQQPPRALYQLADVFLAGYLLLAGLGAWWLVRLKTGKRTVIRLTLAPQPWFVPVQVYFSVLVVGLSFWIACNSPALATRLLGPTAMLLLLPMFLMLTSELARRSGPPRWLGTIPLRYATLVLASAWALCLAWSLLDPNTPNRGLLCNVLFLGVLAAAKILFGLGLRRLLPPQNSWSACGWNVARVYWIIGLANVPGILAHEFVLYQTADQLPLLPYWAVALVSAAIVAFMVSSIWFAILPAYDPYSLAETRRTWYVYAAEVLLALLFVHVRLSLSHLFSGSLAQYWGLMVMAIAFAGVGLGEFFQRLRLPVLAVPLQRTGVFLPLLPLLAFWFQPAGAWMQNASQSSGGALPRFDQALASADFNRHALHWFIAGTIYLIVALTRRSTWFALIGALALNFGFWSLLYQHRELGLGFLSHPQLWLIPLALILLIAEHLNRDRLSPAQSTALRYLGLIVLYVSSTADLFLGGLGNVSMALMLAVLSVLGMFAGIVLRVRAFLFVGFTFLVIVIGAQIWNAAVYRAQTWVWWAAVITLGMLILALFALFEKRRLEVLKMLEELKRWR